MWLAFTGLSMPAVTEASRLYPEGLRSTIGIAQAKNRLHWTVPALSTPDQCDRWSDLMPIVTWQLWLASHWWHSALSLAEISGQAYSRTSGSILWEHFNPIGTQAQPPKLRGKSPVGLEDENNDDPEFDIP